jgi:hypothetical protein
MNQVAKASLALSLSLLGPMACAASAPDADAIVKAVMQDQYGKQYDAKHACWIYAHTTEQGDDLTYCMQPGKPELVDTAKGKQLFVHAANAYDIKDDSRFAYGQTDPGLMGAFQVSIDAKGGWTFVAMDPAMEFGTNGYCGCNQASFVKLSNQGDYGWLFVSGGAWQGKVVADYSIVMPRDGGFADVSRIPRTPPKEQDVTYELKVAERPGPGLFPLRVTKTRDKAKVEDITVDFDPKKHAYQLPGAR